MNPLLGEESSRIYDCEQGHNYRLAAQGLKTVMKLQAHEHLLRHPIWLKAVLQQQPAMRVD